ncbi:MAG: hypothetical protein COT24_01485 [Candidatus Kerfeldbacteria bacterium CG08_land_8_20_14_0_20_40_16]|uniref:YbaK/aminoacyl-tRNA synthetase-associated domain-containing protein n=1 Tax=Candidatus Kerfeldbacteria bacterium CG08_land_8_20_14_0_20_40_16 TaxID=2014244 RepID=A0A2H0YWF7_9BACT|nr:MAG: hypothetical protein COT24_01485 [Candidatus Kerfeldbacteria bacterium CG08_land_8_20_14_0_20_40_16]
MPISKKILDHLDKNKIKYEILKHKTVYTAYDLANTLKKKLSEIAKTLVVKADQSYYLIVVPAHYRLDLGKLKKILQAKKIEIAKENVMAKIFKVKPGAITPFGTIHKVGVVIDQALAKTQKVIMGAGSFTESLHLKIKDFLKLENPTKASIGKKFTSEVISKPKPKMAKKRKVTVRKSGCGCGASPKKRK